MAVQFNWLYVGNNTALTKSGYGLGTYCDPLNPLNLPSFTIRLKFVDGVTPTFSKGTATQVSSTPNVWDLRYYDSSNYSWSKLLRNQTNLIEVLGANSTWVWFMDDLFSGCTSLVSIPPMDTSSVRKMARMCERCTALRSFPELNTSLVTDMSHLCNLCSSLSMFPFLNTSSVTNMESMLGYTHITNLPLFNTSSVKFMDNLCSNCEYLESIPLLNTSSVETLNGAFWNCVNVQSGALALYQQASSQAAPPIEHGATFRNCGSNTTTGAAELAQIPSGWK